MNERLLDNSGYPTEEYLQFIRDYKGDTMPIMDFVKLICETWYYGSMGYRLTRKHKGTRRLELHTLGWSGNEDIIRAIIGNIYLTNCLMSYNMWRVGGHYYFEIREEVTENGVL